MRHALALAAGVLASCSPSAAPAPEQNGVAPVEQAAAPRPPHATGSALQGQVSALNGDISGLTTRETNLGTVVALPTDTLFAFDQAALSPDAETNLAKVAELIRAAPAGPIAITGHTDAKGEDAYNLDLSRRRAEAVAAWMRAQVGVRQRQFSVVGKGETVPVAPNTRPDGSDDPNGRARNRRVELLLPKG